MVSVENIHSVSELIHTLHKSPSLSLPVRRPDSMILHSWPAFSGGSNPLFF